MTLMISSGGYTTPVVVANIGPVANKTVYIVLPGIMGSELYASQDIPATKADNNVAYPKGYCFWPPISLNPASDIAMLDCNSSGISEYPIAALVANDSGADANGNSRNDSIYDNLVGALQETFGKEKTGSVSIRSHMTGG